MNFSRVTIRARITGGSLLIAILISIAAGIVIYNQVQRIVNDDHLRVLESIEGPYVTAITDGDTEDFDPPGPGQLAAVVAPDGTVTLDTLPAGLSEQIPGLASAPDAVSEVEVDEDAYLVKARTVNGEGGAWHVITAARADDEVLDQVAMLLIVSVAVITLGFGAAAWLIGSAALSPVTRLRRSAEELASAPREDLLPVGTARDEISALARTLNELISELRASAARERQIVSDASHEIRTPLAILNTRLELAQREAITLAEMKADVSEAQKTLERLTALATALLELSRIDAEHPAGQATIAHLARELGDAADRGRLRVGGRDIRIDFDSDDPSSDTMVHISEPDFGRVCDNLINNALAAIGAAGTITLRLASSASDVRLSVEDDGGGMDPAYAPHAFDRFSRQSDARTTGGAGLGLAIVAGITANGGGTVHLDNNPGRGLRVIVTLPIATNTRRDPPQSPLPSA